MPAQKLTKARLAQILIMLTILVVAFIWRSLSYQPLEEIDCSQKERCELTLDNSKMIIYRASHQIKIQTDKNNNLKIDLDQNKASNIPFSDNIILLDASTATSIKIRNKDNTIIAVIVL
ncbi:hypothetical protein JKP28_10260 [Vibrio vulnificus]|uniref:hypothetical protein n=1 Tax=Vibrio vulnificus TaxID=672 RepID=UPI001559C498|nr:hypothetical protein [Vibrio vulnificus]MCA3960414.1 hypothetical protein [Vibrio vulnificus]MDS1772524.1 hypothetical protein [Vibrio vulnificus]MDS1853064.1 hypothetical protein [Vibrio vulnificus]HAS8546858.1 hypothetical protein [Vibrio vulnificus]HAS8559537.1 hypothetical protein [Vibrio vulnificus]